jgi:hypothetical protein
MSTNLVEKWVFSGTPEAAAACIAHLTTDMRDILRVLWAAKGTDLVQVQTALSQFGATGVQYMAATLFWARLDEEARKPSQAVPSKTEDNQ